MKHKICSVLLCLMLILPMGAEAMASGEAAAPADGDFLPAETAGETSAPPKEDGADISGEMIIPEAAAEEELTAEELTEEDGPEQTVSEEEAFGESPAEESAGESPVEESAASEAPVPEGVTEDGLLAEDPILSGDPLNPANAWARPRMDGASYGSTYKDFVTRALNNETLRYGVDVSWWQGTINWSKVAAAGVEFVFIRAARRSTDTGALYKDGRFVDYISGAKAAGLKVGVYIFSQSITVKEAEEEAEYLMEIVKDYDIDLPLVYDLEHYTGGRFTNAKLSAREITDMCLAFCAKVEAAGYESMVYANPSMLKNDLYPKELGRLWLANYTKQTSYSASDYEYWQCSDIGEIDGISTKVDLDFWFSPGAQTPPEMPFSDVKTEMWFYNAVKEAYGSGIVNGMTKDTFAPGGTATRGQVITMIYRMAGSPAWTEEAGFGDLTQSYYKDAVNWAAEKKIVTGYSADKFGPDRSITREELVTLLYRMKGAEAGDAALLEGFTDAASINSWARDAMAWAVQNGIVTGYGNDEIRPGANATRAEVCAILMRYAAL